MAEIVCPNKEYTGVVGGVAFAAGKGTTHDPVLIEWFARHGYKVTGRGAPESKVVTLDDDPHAMDLAGVRSAPPEDAEGSKGLTDDMRRARYGDEVGTLLDTNTPTGAPMMVPPTPPPPAPEVAHPGPKEQQGFTQDQADELARTRAGLSATPVAPSKSTRTRKSSRRKSTPRKSSTRKSGGSK